MTESEARLTRWNVALAAAVAATLFSGLPAGATEKPIPSTMLETSGFVARAQRAELVVVVGKMIPVAGLIGCGVELEVDEVLRGRLEPRRGLSSVVGRPDGPKISLVSWEGCPAIGRVLAFDVHPEKQAFDGNDYPPGQGWSLSLDDEGFVHGELLRCHGVTVTEGGRVATNVGEKMRLSTLKAQLAGPRRRLCRLPGTDGSGRHRSLEGRAFDTLGRPWRGQLEAVPVGAAAETSSAAPDDRGRFRLAGVPAGPFWLRATDDAFGPFLIPEGVAEVRVEVDLFGRQECSEKVGEGEVDGGCRLRCGEDDACASACVSQARPARPAACQMCWIDSYGSYGTPGFETARASCRAPCEESCPP